MKTGRVKCSALYVAEMLGMPPEWEIVGVQFNAAYEELKITVQGDSIPGGKEGETVELWCEIAQHEDGRSFKWKPAPEPGPATFIANSATGRCFWCDAPRDEHGPDRVCLKPMRNIFEKVQ